MSGADHLFLVGFMGAGKTTVGAMVAEELDRPLIDLDRSIEEHAGNSVSEIFAEQGEDGFRMLETQELAAVVHAAPSVIACGGGVVLRPENRALLRESGTVVYLQVSAGEAVARVGDADTRPLLAGPGGTLAATSLLAARESLYRSVADVVVDTGDRSPDEVARLVVAAAKEAGL